MPRHAIHLGNAWEPASTRSGPWRRRFGRPAGVRTGDRLVLACERPGGATAPVVVELNGSPLPEMAPGPCRWEQDVTALVDERNELVLSAGGIEPALGDGGRERRPLPAAYGRLTIEVLTD